MTATPPEADDRSPLRMLASGIAIAIGVLAAIAALLHLCGWGWWGAER